MSEQMSSHRSMLLPTFALLAIAVWGTLWVREIAKSTEPYRDESQPCLSLLAEVAKRPRDASLLARLVAEQCVESRREVVRFALEQEPYNRAALVAAAMVALEDDRRSDAIAHLRKLLELYPDPPPSIAPLLRELIRSPDELPQLIPPLLLPVRRWSELSAQQPLFLPGSLVQIEAQEQLFAQALSDLQIEALQSAHRIVDPHTRARELLRLLPLAASSSSRMAIDRATAEALQAARASRAARYLTQRAAFLSLPVLAATIPNDRTPLEGQLYDWDARGAFYLDEIGRSVGVFVPESFDAKLLELRLHEKSRLPLAALRVFSSTDNLRWTERTSTSRTELVRIPGQQLISVMLPEVHAPFWKVTYEYGAASRSVRVELQQLLAVFGRERSTNEEGT